MGLKDIKVPKVEITVGQGSFAVRGLSASDINVLVRKQGPVLRELFNKYISSPGANVQITDLKPVFQEVLVTAPVLVQEILAVAADADAEDRVVLGTLPVATQIETLIQVVMLSLGGDANMGKLTDLALKLTGIANGGMGAILAEMSGLQVSTPGSKASDDK